MFALFSVLAFIGQNPTAPPDFNQQLNSVDRGFQAAVWQLVEKDRAKFKLTGATVAVVVDGKLVSAVAVGLRKVDASVPLLVTDPMHVASNTKGMTALLAGRIAERGLLSFDCTIAKALPAIAATIQPDYASLPIRELFYQRIGAQQLDCSESKYTRLPIHAARLKNAEDYLSFVPIEASGVKHLYRNCNYIAIGAILEAATNIAWEDLMRREVFAPLHMRAAGFGPMGSSQNVSAPWQHELKDGVFKPAFSDNPVYFGPAGTVHCSALDLANYAYARVQGAYGKSTYLKTATWAFLQTPPENSSYACGISTGGADEKGVRDMSHGGTNNLSCSDWWVRNHGRIIVISMINCASPEGNGAILGDVLSLTLARWPK